MEKTIIVLYGKSGRKSYIINNAFKKMNANRQFKVIADYGENSKFNKINIIGEYADKKIGIVSSILDNAFIERFINENCDIIICKSSDKWDTLQQIKELGQTHGCKGLYLSHHSVMLSNAQECLPPNLQLSEDNYADVIIWHVCVLKKYVFFNL
jgi:hypothetical protein